MSTGSRGRIILATYGTEAVDIHWALVMAESFRTFGGALSHAPVILYTPEPSVADIGPISERAGQQDVKTGVFRLPPASRELPFTAKVYAAAQAEREAAGKYDVLAWIDPDAVFVGEPSAFLLEEQFILGYHPVMRKLIGSSYESPADEFWTRVYRVLGVDESLLFPMTTPVDRVRIRPYFNAGMVIVRPERKILSGWIDCLDRLASDPVIAARCRQDRLYALFLHQVALSGAVLTSVARNEMTELPPDYNYPLNLDRQYPEQHRPARLEDLVMFRHDFILSHRERSGQIVRDDRFVRWLQARIPAKR